MLVVAALGMVTNVVQVYAISNHAWLRATALSNGQPFNSYLSLGSAMFGTPTDPNRDNRFFCGEAEDECSLRTLCAKSTPPVMFDNGLPKDTPQQAWCDVLAAGSLATRFLFFGLLIGLGATAFTTLYSAQSIPWVADQFDKIEELGFEDIHQSISSFGMGCAVGLHLRMMTYALAVPDSLGWGTVEARRVVWAAGFVSSSPRSSVPSSPTLSLTARLMRPFRRGGLQPDHGSRGRRRCTSS